MIQEMIEHDLDKARQHALLHQHGYSVAVGKEN
jgi:GDPmannose 4,6-dehydratase